MEHKTPAPRALAAVKAGPPVEPLPVNKQQRITPKVRKAIELMATGECKQITETAARVGLARESLGRALARPHVIEFMRQRALRVLNLAVGRASEVKVALLDCGDSMARDRASTFVLGLADIAPASAPALSLNLEIKAGYVIDLTDKPRTIDHE